MPPRRLRLVYLGTPAAAVPPLRALVDAGFDVAHVVTRPDRRRGRGSALTPSPVKAAALELGLPVGHRVDGVLGTGAELGVVVAFGQLVKPHVLDALPMVNLHFSLLPRWRGAAPVERAILAGDAETGVALMRLEEGLDTGPVHAVARVAIGEDETADELRVRLVEVGSALLVRELTDGLSQPVPQSGPASYAAKIEPGELEIDWSRRAVEVSRLVRLGQAWTTCRGRRLRVLRVEVAGDPEVEGQGPEAGARPPAGALVGQSVVAGEGSVRLVEVQPEGRRPQPADAWLRGTRPAAGERLGR